MRRPLLLLLLILGIAVVTAAPVRRSWNVDPGLPLRPTSIALVEQSAAPTQQTGHSVVYIATDGSFHVVDEAD